MCSINEDKLPEVTKHMQLWEAKQEKVSLYGFSIDTASFNVHKVPRLLLGDYLSDEFANVIETCKAKVYTIAVHYRCAVIDIIDDPIAGHVTVVHQQGRSDFEKAMICSGHFQPMDKEGTFPNYFDSPYPPATLRGFS